VIDRLVPPEAVAAVVGGGASVVVVAILVDAYECARGQGSEDSGAQPETAQPLPLGRSLRHGSLLLRLGILNLMNVQRCWALTDNLL
jgi:hypothetical protein